MSGLILCGKRSTNPYLIKESGISIYTIEELCYYLYNNTYMITKEFFCNELAEYIKTELELPSLAQKLKYSIDHNGELLQMVMDVLSSNEYYTVEYKNYIYRIENKNLHILANKHEYVTIKGTRFCLYGLELDASYYSKKTTKHVDVAYVEKLLGPEPEHKHSIPIVIAHNPNSFDACAKWGAEYVLSGHNHGGFIRLPFIGGIVSPNFRPFPKYSAGIYKHKECVSTMLLSRGLGTHTIKFRLFNKPELMVIKFKPKG